VTGAEDRGRRQRLENRGQSEMIEFEVSKIIIDEKSQEQVVVLKEKEGDKLIPIVIGITEASAIRMKFGGAILPRPLTHDLLKSVIDNLGAKLSRIIIDNLKDGTFYAKLIIKTADGKEKIVDARPSDSIALAVRADSAIFVEDEVISKVSFLTP